MSTRERPKEERNEEDRSIDKHNLNTKEDNIDEWLNDMSENEPATTESPAQESVSPSPPRTSEKEIAKKIKAKNYEKFIATLPNWVNKPWMYVKPTHQEHLNSWVDSWKEVIINYSNLMSIHIINILELNQLYPFKNPSKNKELSKNKMQFVVDKMVQQGLAKWINDERSLVRIYYKSNEEWGIIIYEYLLDTGLAAEVLTIFEIKELNQEWSDLPIQELIEIIDLLVNKDQAKWIGNSKDSFKVIY